MGVGSPIVSNKDARQGRDYSDTLGRGSSPKPPLNFEAGGSAGSGIKSSSRTWTTGRGQRDPKVKPSLSQQHEHLVSDTFVSARPTRLRASGCWVRLADGSNAEMFLPVEHMTPSTEASTVVIRERMRSVGSRLVVRPVDNEQVSMLSSSEAASLASQLVSRRRTMEAGIVAFRNSY